MKIKAGWIASGMCLLALGSSLLSAQESFSDRRQAGWGPFSPWAKAWNSRSLVTVSGEIRTVNTIVPAKGMRNGIGITLKGKPLIIHLGPEWYLIARKLMLKPGMKVTINGSKGKWQGKAVFFASRIRYDHMDFLLRYKNGIPYWSGGLGGWGPASRWFHTWNAQSIVSTEGEITGIESTVPIQGGMEGVVLILKTDTETLRVHAGPKWYLKEQKITFRTGTTVAITGSLVPWQGKPVIMASKIDRDGHTLSIRNAKGVPIWGGS